MADAPIDMSWMRLLVEINRRGSLSSAAEAMGMSQPAVSYQIRNLEQRFGVQLLQRLHRGVRLTEDGRRLFDIAQRAVQEVDELERSIRSTRRRPTVRISTDYAFSSLWLIPRMHAFRQQHPDLDLQIVATQRLGSHWREDADIAVAFGARSDFNASGTLLMPERVIPVCAPAYLDRMVATDPPSHLSAAPLIHLEAETASPWLDWPAYFARSGTVRAKEPSPGDLRFNTYVMVIQAAMAGQGIALGWLGVIDQLLDSGLLVEAGPEIDVPDRGYWLHSSGQTEAPVEQLALWLRTETAAARRHDTSTERPDGETVTGV